MRAPFQHRLQSGAQRQRGLAGAGLAAERHDADGLVEKQIQRHPLLGGATPQSEHLAITADQLHPLVGIDPAERVRVAAEQPNSGVARQIPCLLQIDLTLGEQCVDHLG